MGRFSWGENTQDDTKEFLEPICRGLTDFEEYWSTVVDEQGHFVFCNSVLSNGPETAVIYWFNDPKYEDEGGFYWGPTTHDDLTHFFLDVCYQ